MPLGRKTHLAQSITFTDLRIISFGLVTLLDELPNRRSRHRAGLPCHFAPGFEQSERGNGVDANWFARGSEFVIAPAAAKGLPESFVDQAIALAAFWAG